MKKRFLAILLCLSMVLALMPVPVLAMASGEGPQYVNVYTYDSSCEWTSDTDYYGNKYYTLRITGRGGMAAIDALDWAGHINGRIAVYNGDQPLTLVIENLHLFYNNQLDGGYDKHAPLEVYGTAPVTLLLSGDNSFGTDKDGNIASGNGCNGIGIAATGHLIIEDAPNNTWYNGFLTRFDQGSLTCLAGGGGAAGIGGLYSETSPFPHGDLTINSGTVTVKAGDPSSGKVGGAGIGGSATAGFSPNGGNVTINGGDVSVESYRGAAAIGGAVGYVGTNGLVSGHGGHVVVNGGVLKAKADVTAEVLSGKDGTPYVTCTGMVIGAGANASDVLTTKTNGQYDQSFSVQNAIVSLSANDNVPIYHYFPINVESYEEEAPYLASHIKNCVFGYERHDNNGKRVMQNMNVHGNFKLTQDYTLEKNNIITIPSDATFTVASGTTLTVAPKENPGKILDIPEQGLLWGRANALILEKGRDSIPDGKVVGYGHRPEIFLLDIPEIDIPDNAPSDVEETDENRVKYLAVVEERKGTKKRIVSGNSVAELAPEVGNDDLLTVLTAGYRGFEETADGYEIKAEGIHGVNMSFTANGSLTGLGTNENACFTIKEENGQVTGEGTNIALASSSYTMFSPNKGKGFTIELPANEDMSSGKLSFTAEFDPKDNKALISIPELFGSSFMLESISPVKNSTSLRFEGKLALKTPVVDIAGIDITKLQLDFGSDSVMLGGIAGGGFVDIPKVGGFVGGKAETLINTFLGEGTDEGRFMFSVEAKTPVFDGEFYLDFKEAYGIMLPNSFYLAGKVGTQGIPLVPPTTVAYITGGGLGVYGLAETIGMKRLALPPIRLRMTGSGSIVDVMEGTLDLTVGPGYSNIELSDIEIADIANILEEVGMEYQVNLEQFNYNDRTYDVAAMHSKMYMEAGLELGGFEFLEADGSVGFDAMTGLSVDMDDRKAYGLFRLQSAGELGGSLKIPKGAIFGMPLWDINFADVRAGYNLAGTYAPVVPFENPMSALGWDEIRAHTSFEGAIAAKANFNVLFTSLWARVGYILGGSPSFDGGFGEGPELFSLNTAAPEPVFSYAEEVKGGEQNGDYAFVQLNGKVLADTAKQDGLTLMGVVADTPDGVTLTEIAPNNHTTYNAIVGSGISTPGQVLFVMTAKNEDAGLTKADFNVKKGGTTVTLTDAIFGADGKQSNTNAVPKPNFTLDAESDVAYFTVDDDETYTITCKKPIDIQAVLFTPFAELNDTNTKLDIPTASYEIDNYNSDSKYAIKVYLGEAEGGMDYLIGEQNVTGSTGSLTIPAEGLLAPDGNYYVTVVLMEQTTATISKENNETVTGWVIADKLTVRNSYDYDYTGAIYGTIAAPASATLTYAGNETMKAEWAEVAGAEGYMVRLYNEDGTFTGVTYHTTAEQDGNGNTTTPTSITMALTTAVKGPGYQEIDMKTGVPYKIGVSAYKNVSKTVDMPEGTDVVLESQVVSEEKFSEPAQLSPAAPPTLHYSTNVVPGAFGQHTLLVNSTTSQSITINASESCSITVKDVTDPAKAETVKSVSGATSLNVSLPEFTGSIQLEILAEDDSKDYALEYITVRLDNTASTLTLNDNGKFFKSTGPANITGRTEGGALVCAWNTTDSAITAPAASTHAASDGTFMLQLSEGIFSVEAIDAATNRSTPVKVTVEDGSTVTPEETSFTQYGSGTIAFTLTPKEGTSLTALLHNGIPMTLGSDYAVSGNTYTLTASFLAGLPVGGALFTFDMSDGNDPKALLTIIERIAPSKPSGSSKSSAVGIELAGQGGSIPAQVTVVDGVANLSFDTAKLTALMADPAISGELSIDLTSLSENVSAANFKEADWRIISDAINESNGRISGLALKTNNGALSFDGAAMAAAEAGGDITIRIAPLAPDQLTEEQALMAKNRPVVDISVLCGNVPLTDLKGGTLKVSIPYTPASGENTDFLVIWYLSEDGQLEPYSCKYINGQLHFTLSHLSVYTAAYFPFTDAPVDQWYYGDAAWAYMEGLMSGVGDNRFAPHTDTSRAMVVTLLHRLEGKPAASAASSFADVAANQWYSDAVAWAAANGIVDGYDATRFGPDDPITRQQMAAILYRYAQYKEYDVSVGEDTNILSYNDALDIAEYAMPAFRWACGAGLVQGAAGNLMPQGNAQRCQVAAILHRFCVNNVK